VNIKFKLNRLRHLVFGEKFYKRLDFNWKLYPSRLQVIQHIIDIKKYKTYLEIGCYQDDIFSNISIQNKIGVDPVSGGTVKDTSDGFFKKNNSKFDIIFIDGLHHYKQVKKDIQNSLSFLNVGGLILLHDCMPQRFIEQAVPQAKGTWMGDVWKNIVECRTMPNIMTYTIHADHGIGILLKRPNENTLNLSVSNFDKLKFKDFFYNYKIYLNVISYEDIVKVL
jgi:predicted O-methyltransferase YrrM